MSLKKLILFLSLFSFQVVVAQNHKLDGQLHQLTEDLTKYESNYKALAVQRGTPYFEGNFTAKKLERAIAMYASNIYEDAVHEFKFIFYHNRMDTLNIWLFDAEGKIRAMEAVPVKSDSLMALENTIKFRIKIENQLASRGINNGRQQRYRLTNDQTIDRLSRILFPSSIVSQLSGTKYLCVLPSLNISSIPYGMLKPWSSNGTVIDSMSYSFIHNIREFINTIDDNQDFPDQDSNPLEGKFKLLNPLVIGNPAFTNDCSKDLPSLPGAEAEAVTTAKALGTKALLGDSAIKSEIVKKMTESTFIYLATHGYSDQGEVMDKSFIALHEPLGCGLLTPREIQQLKIPPTAIVVLSACETGNGKVLDAGVIGLARGFLKAGAKTVVMSLWNVDDQETRKLMEIYLEELKKEQPFFPAENWRQAVLRYKKENSMDPLYWAAFQNFGTPMRFHYKNSLISNSTN